MATLTGPCTFCEILADRLPAHLCWTRATSSRFQVTMASEGSLVLVNNVVSQSVPHLHLHAVPRTKGDGLRYRPGPRTRYADDGEAVSTARAISEAYRVRRSP